MKYENNYPCLFIHGLAGYGDQDFLDKFLSYWGPGSRNLMKHLRKQGIECYNPTLGPFDGAWDRCCELYAYIYGGTVDYGKVHSRKHHHKRYGRTYAHGVLEDLGKTEAHKKVNLFGHSFGAPTVKQFIHLLINGSEEERAATPEEELNPLFKGGQGDIIHTVTTLSGVNNGTALANFFGPKSRSVIVGTLFMFNSLLKDTQFPKLWDFHFQKWGVMDLPENIHTHKLSNPLEGLKGSKIYCLNKIDNIAYEMRVDYVQDVINPSQTMSEKIYYFCQRACNSYETFDGYQLPHLKGNPVCTLPGYITGWFHPNNLKKYGVDKSWLPNDGFVNVKGQGAPYGCPYEDGEIGKTDFKPGIWYNLPVIKGDHLVWNGMSGKKRDHFERYDKMIHLFRTLPDA